MYGAHYRAASARELLPSRTYKRLGKYLKKYSGIENISDDQARTSGDRACAEAPGVVQVADALIVTVKGILLISA